MKMDRRKFLKQVGLGSIALASLPTLLDALAEPALAQGRTGFVFLCVSAAGLPGTAAQPAHLIAMGGRGHFDPSKVGSSVEGGGVFNHWTAPGGPPAPLVASGTWKPRLLASYKQIGTAGVVAAGIAELVIDLFPQVPSPRVIRGALLRIVCNLGPAGLQTGEVEGYTLSIPGTDFSAGGTPGPFRQIPSPPPAGSVGLTVFTTVVPD